MNYSITSKSAFDDMMERHQLLETIRSFDSFYRFVDFRFESMDELKDILHKLKAESQPLTPAA